MDPPSCPCAKCGTLDYILNCSARDSGVVHAQSSHPTRNSITWRATSFPSENICSNSHICKRLAHTDRPWVLAAHITSPTLTFSCCLSPPKNVSYWSSWSHGKTCGGALWKKACSGLVSAKVPAARLEGKVLSSKGHMPHLISGSGEAICNITEAAKRISWWLRLKRGEPQGHKLGSDQF